jgi:septal ring factor EnvC (AmiA/AmiB activator)
MNSGKTRAEKTVEAIMKMSLEQVQEKLEGLRKSIETTQTFLRRLHAEREDHKQKLESAKAENNTPLEFRAKRIVMHSQRIENLTRMMGTDVQMLKSLRIMEDIYAKREQELLKQEANNPKETLLKNNNNNNNNNTKGKSLCAKLGTCFGRWTKKNKKSGGRRKLNTKSRRKIE